MTPGIRHHVMDATYGWRHAAPRTRSSRWPYVLAGFILGFLTGVIIYV